MYSLHYQKTKRDMTAQNRFLNKEKWHSQVIWMLFTFREYSLLPEKQMRSHCTLMHTLEEKTFLSLQIQRHRPIIWANFNWTSFDIYTGFYLSTSPSQTMEFMFFTTAIFTETFRCSSWKRWPLYNCFDFVGGTIAGIYRPVLNERVVYSHHTRVHGVKFQSTVLSRR